MQQKTIFRDTSLVCRVSHVRFEVTVGAVVQAMFSRFQTLLKQLLVRLLFRTKHSSILPVAKSFRVLLEPRDLNEIAQYGGNLALTLARVSDTYRYSALRPQHPRPLLSPVFSVNLQGLFVGRRVLFHDFRRVLKRNTYRTP